MQMKDLTDEHISRLAVGMAELNGGDVTDYVMDIVAARDAGDCATLGLTLTADTLESFRRSRRNFREPGDVKMDDGVTVAVDDLQVGRGDQRKMVVIVDCGEFRAVWTY